MRYLLLFLPFLSFGQSEIDSLRKRVSILEIRTLVNERQLEIDNYISNSAGGDLHLSAGLEIVGILGLFVGSFLWIEKDYTDGWAFYGNSAALFITGLTFQNRAATKFTWLGKKYSIN